MPPRAASGRLRFEWWLVALLTSALVVLLVADRTPARLDNLIYDSLLRLARRAPSPDILIVAIDNRSLREIEPWMWSRARHAALIERLAAAHPRAIGYDVLFVEPGQPDQDAQLGRAMAASGAVFVPLLLNVPGTNGASFDAIEPVEPVRRAAAGVGQANLIFDRDGLVRSMYLSEGEGHRQWLQLAELIRRRTGRGTGLPLDEEREGVKSKGLAGRHPVMFAYAGPPGTFPTISAAAVLRGEVPPEFLRDRLVLVGATADGLGDQYSVPLGHDGVMAGVEIQANLLDAMLTGHLVRPVGGLPLYVASLLPLWVLLTAFRHLPPRANILLLLALLATIAIGSAALLLAGIWLPPAAAMIALALVYPFWGWRRLEAISGYMTDELESFRAEPDLIPRKPDGDEGADAVGRQVLLLHDAITRVRDLRRFVSDRMRQLPDATFVSDLDGQLLLTNAAAARLSESLALAPDDRGDMHALLAQFRYDRPGPEIERPTLPQAGGGAEMGGGEVVTADGRWFDLRFALQRADDDTPVGWIVRIVDISEAKAMQRQREHILQLLTHDMRSPQASILAVIDRAGPDALDEAAARRIEGYARRTLALADDFVQLARAETLDYALEEVALDDVLIDAADDLWPQSSARGIPIEVDTPDEPLFVMGERSLLTRALINLIGNAIKYGGGKPVHCALRAGPGVAICTISDQGIGIAPEHLDTLFERFRRAPSAAGRRIEGVGLGLTFVHTVVIRHHGTIRCESTPGEGTTFTVEIPTIA